MSPQAYVFEAWLGDDPDVHRRVAVRGDQTLVDLHAVLRKAFGWHGDFPYTFRLDGRDYTSPLTAEPDAPTADVRLERLGLEPGRELTHVVDVAEEVQITFELIDVQPADDEPFPRIIERGGETELEPEYELGGGG